VAAKHVASPKVMVTKTARPEVTGSLVTSAV